MKMKQTEPYESEVKKFRNDLIENLIDWHIDITDFNVVKDFIIESIESEWRGNIDELKVYLANTNECTVQDIENLLERSNSKNWPEFFKNKKNRGVDDFQIKNNLSLRRVVFLDNDKEEKRRRFKEFKFCIAHHFRRSLECNDIGRFNKLYQISRMCMCCCWQSYIWRLSCYKCTKSRVVENYYEDKENFLNKLSISCCFLTHLFCWPFHVCYMCDKINFEPSEKQFQKDAVIEENSNDAANSEDIQIEHEVNEKYAEDQRENTENEVEIVVEQPQLSTPTKFHYTNKFYKSFLYIAIEGKEETSDNNKAEFYFWIKIPFNFNIDLDDKRDPDLF